MEHLKAERGVAKLCLFLFLTKNCIIDIRQRRPSDSIAETVRRTGCLIVSPLTYRRSFQTDECK